MKKFTVFFLLALGGFLLLAQTASATIIRPRPNPPTVPFPTQQPVASAD